MTWAWGDGFDLYAATGDGLAGYWDSGTGPQSIVAGRFAGSQAVNMSTFTAVFFVKSSGTNDAIHHIVCAFNQTSVLSGSALGFYFQLLDASTGQVCIVFRQDGAILLTSATPGGTVLATYTGAVTAANTWFGFEFEVVINNTTGSFTVRKNGNTSNDFSATSLNTRPGTNNYANKLQIGMNTQVATQLDDLFWRSDASSVAWMGDIRCYTRMPASDVSAQFSRNAGTTNFGRVNEAQQDGITTYVYDSNPGDADFYGIASIASTPATTVAVTTRGFIQKSDAANARTAAVQLKSGAATVAAPTATLATSFGWVWRTDVVDPNTSAAWTAAAVNNAQIGPKVIA